MKMISHCKKYDLFCDTPFDAIGLCFFSMNEGRETFVSFHRETCSSTVRQNHNDHLETILITPVRVKHK